MIHSLKSDFPIFQNNPWLVYLDSAATLQKPQHVIDRVSAFLSNDYANIHRWWYSLSERSEELYRQTRKKVAQFINAEDDEIVFTSNSTDSVNLLVRSLIRSWTIHSWDKILLSTLEHHANLVPWQLLAELTWAQLERIDVDESWTLDIEHLLATIDKKTKVVALTLCSNVTWIVRMNEIKMLCEKIKPLSHRPYIVVDASQAIVHRKIDVEDLWVDSCFFTGHKLWAHTWIWVLRWKKEFLNSLKPWKVGGGAIEQVTKTWSTYLWSPDCFEPWTPNLVWAVSLLAALEYIESIGEWSFEDSYARIEHIEKPLIDICKARFSQLMSSWNISLLWSLASDRIGLFSFINKESTWWISLWQKFAEKNICIRCGAQCVHIFHENCSKIWCNITQSCRISLWAYNEMSDVERFFDELDHLWM